MRTHFFSKRRTRILTKENDVDKIKRVDKIYDVDKINSIESFLNITIANFYSNDTIDVKDFFKLIIKDERSIETIVIARKVIDKNYFIEKIVICCEKTTICFLETFRRTTITKESIISFLKTFNKDLANDNKKNTFNRSNRKINLITFS